MGSRSGLKPIALALGLAQLAVPAGAEAPCRDDSVYLRGDWGRARITVDLADTPETRSRGLMFVEEVPTMGGMLFVYEQPQPVAFWMKNTLIPLDMLFADAGGTIRRVHHEAQPGDLTAIPGGEDIQFVLEINGGLAARLGIGAGSEMRHPAIADEAAAWPCESGADGKKPLSKPASDR
ncbi:DUF192 domain-containing protein [Marivita sp. GX14005]|uniref:DUF192 domain-containing protein n=1 Tax=Marivita sp. GX14005 TaxID=2942276 RepID=UPI00201947AC|nr:DUF192 domain-containing protein [Marivita sp. GX14005]MCL3883559.1 DUF192 domain-containing protein [Marivita sp. GX14005]